MSIDDLIEAWTRRGESLQKDPVCRENRGMGDGLIAAAEELGDWRDHHLGETVA